MIAIVKKVYDRVSDKWIEDETEIVNEIDMTEEEYLQPLIDIECRRFIREWNKQFNKKLFRKEKNNVDRDSR